MARTVIQIIASALAKQYNLSAADSSAFIDSFFAIISEELKKGNQVKIKGLGTFKVQRVKPRESVNVNTGERVLIEGHDKISFTPDAAMKELVNKPFSQFETVVINDGVDTKELEKIPTESNDREIVEDSIKSETIEEPEKTISSPEESAPKDETITKNEEQLKEIPNVVEEEEYPKDEKKEEVGESSDTEKIDSKEEAIVEEPTNNPNSKVERLEKEEPRQEETIVEHPKTEVKKIKEAPKEEPQDSDSDIESYVDNKENGILKLVAVIAVIVIICLGVFLWIKSGGINLSKPAKEVATKQVESPKKKVDNGIKVIQEDNKKDTTIIKKIEKRDDSYAEMNNDARIRYGAYNIIGVDRVIVLRKGQTMASISRKTLGADMIGYFQVLNGCNSMEAGDTLKVPKVELRPEYRKK